MIITCDLNGYYDWEPLPEGVTPTERDKKALRVKPDASGRWLMRVERKGETHVKFAIPEFELIRTMLYDELKGGGGSRTAAVLQSLKGHLPHNAHRKHFVRVAEVVDDGPDPELYRKFLESLKDDAGELGHYARRRDHHGGLRPRHRVVLAHRSRLDLRAPAHLHRDHDADDQQGGAVRRG